MCLSEFQFTPLSGVCLTHLRSDLLVQWDRRVKCQLGEAHVIAMQVACPELASQIYCNSCRESNNCSPLSSNKKFLGFLEIFKICLHDA